MLRVSEYETTETEMFPGGEKYTVYTVVDSDTGVNYFLLYDDSGSSPPFMCPKYNRNGNIMISDESETDKSENY